MTNSNYLYLGHLLPKLKGLDQTNIHTIGRTNLDRIIENIDNQYYSFSNKYFHPAGEEYQRVCNQPDHDRFAAARLAVLVESYKSILAYNRGAINFLQNLREACTEERPVIPTIDKPLAVGNDVIALHEGRWKPFIVEEAGDSHVFVLSYSEDPLAGHMIVFYKTATEYVWKRETFYRLKQLFDQDPREATNEDLTFFEIWNSNYPWLEDRLSFSEWRELICKHPHQGMDDAELLQEKETLIKKLWNYAIKEKEEGESSYISTIETIAKASGIQLPETKTV